MGTASRGMPYGDVPEAELLRSTNGRGRHRLWLQEDDSWGEDAPQMAEGKWLRHAFLRASESHWPGMSQMEKAGPGQNDLGDAGSPASASSALLRALPTHREHMTMPGERSQKEEVFWSLHLPIDMNHISFGLY